MKIEKMLCSFCNLYFFGSQDILSSETGGKICRNCSKLAYFNFRKEKEEKDKERQVFSPFLIKDYLDRFVVGQDVAKEVLSVICYRHLLRINSKSKILRKHNLMFLGPSGTGKTYLVETAAKLLNLPFAKFDVASATQTGYIGSSVSDAITKNLFENSNRNIELCQKGIVFFDEIDKIGNYSTEYNNHSTPVGKGVQQNLLRLVEGTKVSLESFPFMSQSKFNDKITIDTSNILFIFAGVFSSITDSNLLIQKNKTKEEIYFSLNERKRESYESFIEAERIVDFGFLEEIVGRISLFVRLFPLNKKQLKEIIFETEKPIINDYYEYFKIANITLELTDSLVNYIIVKSKFNQFGARGLHHAFNEVLINYIYRIQEYKKKKIKKIILDYKFKKVCCKFLK